MTVLTFDDVVRRIAAVSSVPTARLTPDAALLDLVSDSLALIEVAVDLQEEFDVVLTEADFRDIRTVGDLASLLQSRAGV